MTDQNAASDETKAGEQIDYKAEMAKLQTELEGVKKTNEDLRLEFMSEDYLNFLNSKDAQKEPEKKVEKQTTPDDEWSNLTPKQIYERALKDAEERMNSKLSEQQKAAKAEADARTASEIKDFAASHSDFEAYRQVMAGLAYDPKYANYSLEKLYNAAKDHVKSLAGASDEEKAKSRKSGGEKPGHATGSFQKSGKRLTADEANEEAWNEVVGSDGLPPAF